MGEVERTEALVVFRVLPSNEVMALFPNEVRGYGQVAGFTHAGGMTSVDYAGILRQSRRASTKEYKALVEELDALGYTVKVRQRRPRVSVTVQRKSVPRQLKGLVGEIMPMPSIGSDPKIYYRRGDGWEAIYVFHN